MKKKSMLVLGILIILFLVYLSWNYFSKQEEKKKKRRKYLIKK